MERRKGLALVVDCLGHVSFMWDIVIVYCFCRGIAFQSQSKIHDIEAFYRHFAMESTDNTLFDIAYVYDYFIEKRGGINKGCKYIAKRLNHQWVWKHIYNVYRGAKPSKELVNRLQLLMNPPRKRYRLKIEGTKEQFKRWQTLTMEERRNALDEKVKGL